MASNNPYAKPNGGYSAYSSSNPYAATQAPYAQASTSYTAAAAGAYPPVAAAGPAYPAYPGAGAAAGPSIPAGGYDMNLAQQSSIYTPEAAKSGRPVASVANKGKARTTVLRKGGGEVWEDQSLLEWDPCESSHFAPICAYMRVALSC